MAPIKQERSWQDKLVLVVRPAAAAIQRMAKVPEVLVPSFNLLAEASDWKEAPTRRGQCCRPSSKLGLRVHLPPCAHSELAAEPPRLPFVMLPGAVEGAVTRTVSLGLQPAPSLGPLPGVRRGPSPIRACFDSSSALMNGRGEVACLRALNPDAC